MLAFDRVCPINGLNCSRVQLLPPKMQQRTLKPFWMSLNSTLNKLSENKTNMDLLICVEQLKMEARIDGWDWCKTLRHRQVLPARCDPIHSQLIVLLQNQESKMATMIDLMAEALKKTLMKWWTTWLLNQYVSLMLVFAYTRRFHFIHAHHLFILEPHSSTTTTSVEITRSTWYFSRAQAIFLSPFTLYARTYAFFSAQMYYLFL